MSEEGVFAVHRGIFKHPLFDGEAYTRRDAWTWLLGNAAWKPTRIRVGREIVQLSRGQLSHSERFLAEKWGWSKSRVHRFLARLETENMVILGRSKTEPEADQQADHETNLITICNYDEYQFGGTTERTAEQTQTEPEADQQRTKEEEGKKGRSKNNTPSLRSGGKRAKARTPLADDWSLTDQNRAHATDLGFTPEQIASMAENFANHHRAKGNLMADWSAAWRTWCGNEIKFGRSAGNGQGRPRAFQDDSRSLRLAAERMQDDIAQGTIKFAPRPSLMPGPGEGDIRLLPKG